MKKVLAVGALLASLTFTFQPATATVPLELEAVQATDTVITAPAVLLAQAEPLVTTEPAPVAVVEPATVPATEPAPEAPAPVFTEPPLRFDYGPAPVEAPAPIEPAVVVYEDSPAWDCSTMGNRICGLEEAFALSGLDRGAFSNLYLGIEPAGPARPGYRVVPSVINPTLQYVFVQTKEDVCSSLELGEAWAGWGTFCGIPTTPEPPAPSTPADESTVSP